MAPGDVFLSIRITSAPISANIMAAKGHGPKPTISMTRKPDNGPLIDCPILEINDVNVDSATASQRPRNNFFHNLIGTTVNALHPRIDIHLRDRILKHITISPKQL